MLIAAVSLMIEIDEDALDDDDTPEALQDLLGQEVELWAEAWGTIDRLNVVVASTAPPIEHGDPDDDDLPEAPPTVGAGSALEPEPPALAIPSPPGQPEDRPGDEPERAGEGGGGEPLVHQSAAEGAADR